MSQHSPVHNMKWPGVGFLLRVISSKTNYVSCLAISCVSSVLVGKLLPSPPHSKGVSWSRDTGNYVSRLRSVYVHHAHSGILKLCVDFRNDLNTLRFYFLFLGEMSSS